MKALRTTFGQFDLSYLIKTYIFSIVLAYFFWNYVFVDGAISVKIFIIVNMILFPFATIIYDSLIELLFGGHVLVLPIIILILYKFIKLFFLYMTAIILAPIGFLFLYIRSKTT